MYMDLLKSSLGSRLWPDLVVVDVPDVDGVRGVLFLALLIRVAGRDGQQGAIAAERQRGDGGGVALVLVQPLLVLPIPHVDDAVAAAGGKRAVAAVEGDRVHREHHVLAVLLPPVTLERILPRLRLLRRLKVLHRHAPLHAAQRVALAVGVAPDAARLEAQRRLPLLLGAALVNIADVKNKDLPVGGRHHDALPSGVHAVHLAVERHGGHAAVRRVHARVPHLHRLVPAPGEQQPSVRQPLDALYGLVV
mmetsp:Transcript_19442/g.49927  ORF Transcript_19442/g.49927 Transcript_19442/m.49927 type:complete len:249 (+) Transcript_19442:135-881(+)